MKSFGDPKKSGHPNVNRAETDRLYTSRPITAELAKDDPEALGDLQVLFEKARQAAGSIDR